ncbi:choline dehydrogenase [Kribbella pittospori]|uniref:Choline dehydrogenase n=1 Tax=Kribbella pittospori TaxID=722689 RepID=A0A4R0JYJ1_9ACTN|nr:GMC family oxidoreductase N-terminal domain-containing protein [Kribbella pittospori]TCC50398.1 choline dehydrogenase [Kribbella pittospori]
MRSYEYVVVGAGTAGCVLAARLSESGEPVLLLEAGGAEPLELMAVPPAWPALMGSAADWADQTVPQQVTGARVPWPRGRGLGGSSSINAMNFVRGHRAGYDAWAEAGAKGWGFDDLLPFFKRSESTKGRDPALRGVDGPLMPGPAVQPHPISTAGVAAAAQSGYPIAHDISGGLEEGFGFCDLNIVDGRRQSAADAYLIAAMSRPNLTVVTGALVRRLLLDDNGCRAVEYDVRGETFVAECTGEVVLAAGAVGSPQLLMLSGIGPADHLKSLGIKVVADLPGVGANLHDHPLCGVVYQSAEPVPPGLNNHGEVQGMLSTGIGEHGPDVQVMFVDVPLREDSLPGPDIGHGYSIMVSLVSPYSRGSIRLAGSDPDARPVIDPAYYSDPRDLDIVAEGLRTAREIGAAPALGRWRGSEVLPGAETDLYRYIRTNLRSYSHYAGTCAIGIDDRSVVDRSLHVHGIRNLRVADASVMPSPISANTNATVYAIAERAADLIRPRRRTADG